MGTFTIDAPDGRSYTIEGDNAAGALSALKQHLGQDAGAPAPDKYQQAAASDIAAVKASGGDEGAGLTRRLAHGATLGADSAVLAALQTPLEMIRRRTFSPAEGYDYAKAREDQIMGDARANTGLAGSAAEMLGGGVAGGGLANAGITTARLLGPQAGIIPRVLSGAADSGALGAVAGANEGNGLVERAANAGKGLLTGAAIGGAMPIAGTMLHGVTAPIIANIRARSNPAAYAESQVARAIHESGVNPDEISLRTVQAANEGQPQFTAADAMGNAGHEMLGVAARGPGAARTAIVDALEARQAGQGRRVASALAEGFQTPRTAAQTEAAMTAARDTAANAEYGAVRGGSNPVDVVGPINHIDGIIGTGPGQNLQTPNDSIETVLRGFRERLARVNPDDFSAVQRIRGDMADAAQSAAQGGHGNRARLIRGAIDQLDIAMETASPGFRQANANFRQRSQDIEAIGEGRAAAMRGRTEDTIPAFQGMNPQAQQAFRTGYADPLIEASQAAAFGANKARPLTNDAFQAEAGVMAPGNDMMQRRLGREMTMFEGRATATGGSPTAKNLAHDTAMSVDPHLIGQIVTGNVHGAIRSLLAAGHNAMTGNTPQVRQEVARILLQNGTNVSPAALRQMVEGTIARLQHTQNVTRGISGAASRGFSTGIAEALAHGLR